MVTSTDPRGAGSGNREFLSLCAIAEKVKPGGFFCFSLKVLNY